MNDNDNIHTNNRCKACRETPLTGLIKYCSAHLKLIDQILIQPDNREHPDNRKNRSTQLKLISISKRICYSKLANKSSNTAKADN